MCDVWSGLVAALGLDLGGWGMSVQKFWTPPAHTKAGRNSPRKVAYQWGEAEKRRRITAHREPTRATVWINIYISNETFLALAFFLGIAVSMQFAAAAVAARVCVFISSYQNFAHFILSRVGKWSKQENYQARWKVSP